MRSDTAARVLAAIPAIAVAIFIVAEGGLVFAVGVIVLGILAQTELYTMMSRVRPVNLAGFLTLIALVLAALYGGKSQVLLVLVLSVPLTFFLGLLRPRRENVSWAMAVTFLGIVWIGLAGAHAGFLRELDHGGGVFADVPIGALIRGTPPPFGGPPRGPPPPCPADLPDQNP